VVKRKYDATDKLISALGDVIRKVDLTTMPTCKFCGSDNVVYNGHRKGTQYFLCRNCGRGFVDNKGVPRGRFPIDVVSSTLYNYYAGMSLNAICEGVKQASNSEKTVSDTTVYNWIAKYTAIALNEAANHKPQVGKSWVMDETIVKLDGKQYWFVTAIDKDTRFLLGAKLSTNRNKKDIQAVLEEATAKTGIIPAKVFTDGWGGYRDAMEQAYGAESKHIVTKPFTDADMSTNLMERWNGTLKDRIKPMRGLSRSTAKPETFQLILDGFVFFYNYLRPHMALGGKTPAQFAKADYPYQSWGDIVRTEMPREPLTDEDKTRYRVQMKARRLRTRRNPRRLSDTATSLGGIRL
jgi:transposase-like protein